MSLRVFMQALKTPNVKVTLNDSDGTELIKFFSDGYTGVEDTLLDRTVKKFEITNATAIVIILNDSPVDSGTSENDG